MQITNNNTTVNLNETALLNMICDFRITKLEIIFKEKYQVKVITDLPKETFFSFLYLCIVVLDFKARELADIYDLSVNAIREGTKKIFTKQHTNKQFYGLLYSIYIAYNQENKVA